MGVLSQIFKPSYRQSWEIEVRNDLGAVLVARAEGLLFGYRGRVEANESSGWLGNWWFMTSKVIDMHRDDENRLA